MFCLDQSNPCIIHVYPTGRLFKIQIENYLVLSGFFALSEEKEQDFEMDNGFQIWSSAPWKGRRVRSWKGVPSWLGTLPTSFTHNPSPHRHHRLGYKQPLWLLLCIPIWPNADCFLSLSNFPSSTTPTATWTYSQSSAISLVKVKKLHVYMKCR